MTETKRIRRFRRPGDLSTLIAGRDGVETTVDPDLGIRMHGAKDWLGVLTKFLGKDLPARVASLVTLDGMVNGVNIQSLYDGLVVTTSVSEIVAGESVVDSFDVSADGGCTWNIFVSDGTNMRCSSVNCVWQYSADNVVSGAEISTDDIGDTSDVVFFISLESGTLSLNIDVATSGWTVRTTRQVI